VAIVHRESSATRAAGYNALDLLSKNLVAIVVAIQAINSDTLCGP